jgi:Tfp pilus assembly protein PilZ
VAVKILKLRVRSADEYDSLFQQELPGGGLFVPTTSPHEVGEVVVIELVCPDLPNPVMIRGVVRSWRSSIPRLRIRAGAVVEFDAEEAHKREFVRDALAGNRTEVPRRRHNRLPVSIPVRYRMPDTAQFIDGAISEISVGGAMLNTQTPLPLETDVIVEIVPPGAAAPIAISSRVSYQVPTGGTGLRFVSRDGDGSRRLRELVRRLRTA